MTDHRFTSTADAAAHFEAQGSCPPGTEGFWQVWGARAYHARPGDLLATSGEGDALKYDLLAEVDTSTPVRTKFTNAEGEVFNIGNLFPGLVLLRWDTHHTLA